MSRLTKAIYREVLDEIWINGAVPNDPLQVGIMIGYPDDEMVAAWPEIHNCLVSTKRDPDLFTSERIEKERKRFREFLRSKREAGQIGGRASGRSRRQRRDIKHDIGEANAKQNEALLHSASSKTKQNEATPTNTPTNTPTPTKEKGTSLRSVPRGAPETLPVTEADIEWGNSHAVGVDLVLETQIMLDWFRGKGICRADWLATRRNWWRKKAGEVGNGRQQRESEAQARERRTAEAANSLVRRVDEKTSGGIQSGSN